MISRYLLFTLLAGSLDAAEPPANAPWTLTRSLNEFSSLLKRSPFSLPTVEESAPLAQRFSLTGAIALDGENHIFVFDKTTLKRERVSATPGSSGLRLIEFLPDPDPRKIRATIRLGEQTATIAFTPVAMPSGTSPAASAESGAARPQMPVVSTQISLPAAREESAKKPGRLVIRRPKISGNYPPAQ